MRQSIIVELAEADRLRAPANRQPPTASPASSPAPIPLRSGVHFRGVSPRPRPELIAEACIVIPMTWALDGRVGYTTVDGRQREGIAWMRNPERQFTVLEDDFKPL